MFERFTESARDVVVRARQGAKELQHPQIGSEHLLLALVGADPGTAGAGGTAASGTAALVLRGAGLDEQRVRAAIERPAGPTAGPGANAKRASLAEAFHDEANAALRRQVAAGDASACPHAERNRSDVLGWLPASCTRKR